MAVRMSPQVANSAGRVHGPLDGSFAAVERQLGIEREEDDHGQHGSQHEAVARRTISREVTDGPTRLCMARMNRRRA